jgi:hypothetical protein
MRECCTITSTALVCTDRHRRMLRRVWRTALCSGYVCGTLISAPDTRAPDGDRNAELSNANKSFVDRRVTGDPPCPSPRRRATSTQTLESTSNHESYFVKHRTGVAHCSLLRIRGRPVYSSPPMEIETRSKLSNADKYLTRYLTAHASTAHASTRASSLFYLVHLASMLTNAEYLRFCARVPVCVRAYVCALACESACVRICARVRVFACVRMCARAGCRPRSASPGGSWGAPPSSTA